MPHSDPALRAALDPLFRKVGLYAAYTVNKSEYIGTTSDDIITYFEQSSDWVDPPSIFGVPLEAAKYHWDSGNVHDHSFKRVKPGNAYRQWHVHLWETAHGVDIASHAEYRANPKPIGNESWHDVYHRLRTHYRPGMTYIRGAAPEDLLQRISR